MTLVDNRYLNRELSWLDFNARVRAIAENPATPLLERTKFLAIHASNLDEFYMVRVAGLKRQEAAGLTSRIGERSNPKAQLKAIAQSALPQVQKRSELFASDIMPRLRENGVDILRWADLGEVQRKDLTELFERQIFPVVTPLAVDPIATKRSDERFSFAMGRLFERQQADSEGLRTKFFDTWQEFDRKRHRDWLKT